VIDGLDLLVDAEEDTLLEAELWDTGRGENYVPHTVQTTASARVKKGEKQWVQLNLCWKPQNAQNAFIIIKSNGKLALHVSDQPQTGVIAFAKGPKLIVSADLEDHQPHQPVVQWSMRPFVRKPVCFRLLSQTRAFLPEKAADGYHRPYAGPHMWSSAAMQPGVPEWLELSWPQPRNIRSVHLTLNDDVNEDLINLHHHRTPFEAIPELAQSYLVQAYINGDWATVAEKRDNHKRKHVHTFDEPLAAERIRIVVEATNGCPRAEIVEMRVYE
jgi:hypothetical protein